VKVIDEQLLADFRGPGTCEWCGRQVVRREPHHIYARGMGGGGRLDVRVNLVALCAPFSGGDDCHDAAHDGRITKDDLLPVVAGREGTSPGAIRDEIFRLLRAPKGEPKPRKAKPAPKRRTGPTVAVACPKCGAKAKALVQDFIRGRSRCACGGLHDRLARAS
jgi:hypothetical protein